MILCVIRARNLFLLVRVRAKLSCPLIWPYGTSLSGVVFSAAPLISFINSAKSENPLSIPFSAKLIKWVSIIWIRLLFTALRDAINQVRRNPRPPDLLRCS